jgi:glycosyltransferase involved in cell wall biosynthesis
MKVSVALCTHNGERFLREQLDSLIAQTRRPDELIICDDASNDATGDIIQKFAREAPFPVQVQINLSALGTVKNFENAIGSCKGDLVFLCDQDDVWLPEKIDLLEQHFNTESRTDLFFSNARLVDHQTRPELRDLFAEIGFDQRKQRLVKNGRALDVMLRANYICGATMAFRASFKQLLLPIPEFGPLIHDGWIALLLSAVGKVSFQRQPLISYRLHDRQQMGLARVSTFAQVVHARRTDREYYRTHARQLSEALARVVAYGIDERRERLLRQKIAHLSERAELSSSQLQRLGSISKEVLNLHYHRFSRGWFSAAKDLFA